MEHTAQADNQTTLDRQQRKGQGIDDDWLRRWGPAHFAHVNCRGTLSFQVDRYLDMLLDDLVLAYSSRTASHNDGLVNRFGV